MSILFRSCGLSEGSDTAVRLQGLILITGIKIPAHAQVRLREVVQLVYAIYDVRSYSDASPIRMLQHVNFWGSACPVAVR